MHTPITFKTPSTRTAGTTYRLTLTSDGWRCSCPATVKCIHIKAAEPAHEAGLLDGVQPDDVVVLVEAQRRAA